MTRRARRVPALVVALLLVVVLCPAAWAVFNDTATVTAGPSTGTTALTSGSLGAAGTPSAAQADGAAPLTITWTPATVSGGGTPVAGAPAPSGYDVIRYADATTTTGTVVCTVGAGVTTCTTTPLPTTPAHYGVRARLGAAWTSDSARVLHTDQRGPVVRATQPAAGLSLGIVALQGNVNAACNPAGTTTSAVACGTAVDTAGVAQVRYRLQRAVVLGATSCWSGSAWVAGACTQSLAATLSSTAPGATAAWRVPGAPATAYTSVAASFTLTVEATDANGRLTTSTTTFSTLL